MNRQTAIQIISGQRRGLPEGALRTLLWPAGKLYGLVMLLRRWAYRRGLLPGHDCGLPVISVGNLTTGGAGKTPLVALLAKRLSQAGRRPAVLTRGYGAVAGPSDEAQILQQALRRADPRVQGLVMVNPDRLAGAAAARAAGADVLIMDDGFQHLRLRRALDIALIDATCPFGYGHCLPRGLLREPMRALRAAGAVVITRADQVAPAELERLIATAAALSPGASIHTAAHRPTHISTGDGQTVGLEELKGKRVLAFCGLGNPRAFFDCLRKAGAAVEAEVAFDDHAVYGPAELARLAAVAKDSSAKLAVTTSKDAVKLNPAALPLPLWVLHVELTFLSGQEQFWQKIASATRAVL